MSLIEAEIVSSIESHNVEIECVDYVECYVGNLRMAEHFYSTALGFTPIAYAGLETGSRDRTSFLMQQGEIRVLLTAGLAPESDACEQVRMHGDTVKDIAFRVSDADRAFEVALERGAIPVTEPLRYETERGCFKKSTIAGLGHTLHSFIEREAPLQHAMPGFQPIAEQKPHFEPGLSEIDHIALSVEQGGLDEAVDFYRQVLGFRLSHQEDVSTEYSAMNSKAVQNPAGTVRFPIMEPAAGRRRSQIEEYLAFHRGPGAQHIAFLSGNIAQAVRALKAHRVDFLRTPDTYYNMLGDRVGEIEEDLDTLRELSILVDRDEWGYLLQIFSKPLHNRPTLFIEVIQRIGARGFGGGNIKALFESMEREQALRGNL